MSETQEYQDPDDILRDINLNDEDEVDKENCRLTKKRRGFRSSFTSIVNSINNLITASRGTNGTVNRSQANKNALQRAREKLEVRYEKLQTLNNRLMVITQDTAQEENDYVYQGFHQVWYQGGVKATVSGVVQDLKFKISKGSDQNW